MESYMKRDEAEEFEPYDRRLHDRMTSLHAELEAETLRVSQLRREAPARATRIYEERLRREFDGDERILVEIAKKTEADDKAGDLGIRPLERKEEIEEEYTRATRILKELQTVWVITFHIFNGEMYADKIVQTLPATAHKLTRAQDALDYVQSKQ